MVIAKISLPQKQEHWIFDFYFCPSHFNSSQDIFFHTSKTYSFFYLLTCLEQINHLFLQNSVCTFLVNKMIICNMILEKIITSSLLLLLRLMCLSALITVFDASRNSFLDLCPIKWKHYHIYSDICCHHTYTSSEFLSLTFSTIHMPIVPYIFTMKNALDYMSKILQKVTSIL